MPGPAIKKHVVRYHYETPHAQYQLTITRPSHIPSDALRPHISAAIEQIDLALADHIAHAPDDPSAPGHAARHMTADSLAAYWTNPPLIPSDDPPRA